MRKHQTLKLWGRGRGEGGGEASVRPEIVGLGDLGAWDLVQLGS